MTEVTVITVAPMSGLDQAVVLQHSLRRVAPDWRVVLVLADSPRAGAIEALRKHRGFDEVIVARDPVTRRELQRVNEDAASLSLAIMALDELFSRPRAGPIIYIARDTFVFAQLAGLADLATRGGTSTVLVPKVMTPACRDAAVDNELCVLQTGTYEPGLLAVAPSHQGRAFVDWFRARLEVTKSILVPPPELDPRRILDLVPSLFDGVAVSHDAGIGVSVDNLRERSIRLGEHGNYAVAGGHSLKTLRFSAAGGPGPSEHMRQDPKNIHLVELWRYYLEQLGQVAESPGTTPDRSRPASDANH